MSTRTRLDRPAGATTCVAGHDMRGWMERHMDMLFSARWKRPGQNAGEIDWSHLPSAGLGRLLAAFAIIATVVALLDGAASLDAGKPDSSVASPYDPIQNGR